MYHPSDSIKTCNYFADDPTHVVQCVFAYVCMCMSNKVLLFLCVCVRVTSSGTHH